MILNNVLRVSIFDIYKIVYLLAYDFCLCFYSIVFVRNINFSTYNVTSCYLTSKEQLFCPMNVFFSCMLVRFIKLFQIIVQIYKKTDQSLSYLLG